MGTTANIAQGRLSRRCVTRSLAALAVCGLRSRVLAQPLGDHSIAEKVQSLKPGEFLWEPEVAPTGPVLMIVSLANQRAYLYRNGLLIGISTCSTGQAGHETPTGVFTILQKQVDHKSNLYNDAPMPFMQRLTWGGIAMHAGNLPGYPASHGCVRVPLAFARNLYGISKLGMTVVIMEGGDVPRIAPSPDMLGDGAQDQSVARSGGDTSTFWQPGRAKSGPLSIIISGADQRMLVLRNGIVIGSATVGFRESVHQPEAFTLLSISSDGRHWGRLLLMGVHAGASEVTEAERGNVMMPDAFRAQLRTILVPGTTLIITPDTLKAGGAGQQLTVLTGEQ